ncbi:MAG: hypothetical protein V4682_02370 [Patescibacteria group bacterium]
MKRVFIFIGLALALCFALTYFGSGSSSLGMVVVIVVAVILIALLVIAILAASAMHGKKKGGADTKAPPTVPGAAPAPPNTEHRDHGHHKAVHHDHDDHHSTPLSKVILNWSIAIGAAVIVGAFVWWLLVGMGAGQKPGLTHVERFNRYTEQVAARATPAAAICTPGPVAWQSVTAPPSNAAKSAMIPIPDCHYIRFCDKTQDPECNAATFEGARFNVWCTTRTRNTELPLETSGDQAVNACRPQSKGDEPIKLEYAFIFSPPV